MFVFELNDKLRGKVNFYIKLYFIYLMIIISNNNKQISCAYLNYIFELTLKINFCLKLHFNLILISCNQPNNNYNK